MPLSVYAYRRLIESYIIWFKVDLKVSTLCNNAIKSLHASLNDESVFIKEISDHFKTPVILPHKILSSDLEQVVILKKIINMLHHLENAFRLLENIDLSQSNSNIAVASDIFFTSLSSVDDFYQFLQLLNHGHAAVHRLVGPHIQTLFLTLSHVAHAMPVSAEYFSKMDEDAATLLAKSVSVLPTTASSDTETLRKVSASIYALPHYFQVIQRLVDESPVDTPSAQDIKRMKNKVKQLSKYFEKLIASDKAIMMMPAYVGIIHQILKNSAIILSNLPPLLNSSYHTIEMHLNCMRHELLPQLISEVEHIEDDCCLKHGTLTTPLNMQLETYYKQLVGYVQQAPIVSEQIDKLCKKGPQSILLAKKPKQENLDSVMQQLAVMRDSTFETSLLMEQTKRLLTVNLNQNAVSKKDAAEKFFTDLNSLMHLGPANKKQLASLYRLFQADFAILYPEDDKRIVYALSEHTRTEKVRDIAMSWLTWTSDVDALKALKDKIMDVLTHGTAAWQFQVSLIQERINEQNKRVEAARQSTTLFLKTTQPFVEMSQVVDGGDSFEFYREKRVQLGMKLAQIRTAIAAVDEFLQSMPCQESSSVSRKQLILGGQTVVNNFASASPHPPCGHILPMTGEKEKRMEVIQNLRNDSVLVAYHAIQPFVLFFEEKELLNGVNEKMIDDADISITDCNKIRQYLTTLEKSYVATDKSYAEHEQHFKASASSAQAEKQLTEFSTQNALFGMAYESGRYDLGLMSETKRDPRKIYLDTTTEGLQYEVIGLDGALKQNTIPWDKLPEDFPRNPSDIVHSQVGLTPILLDYTSEAGHTQSWLSKKIENFRCNTLMPWFEKNLENDVYLALIRDPLPYMTFYLDPAEVIFYKKLLNAIHHLENSLSQIEHVQENGSRWKVMYVKDLIVPLINAIYSASYYVEEASSNPGMQMILNQFAEIIRPLQTNQLLKLMLKGSKKEKTAAAEDTSKIDMLTRWQEQQNIVDAVFAGQQVPKKLSPLVKPVRLETTEVQSEKKEDELPIRQRIKSALSALYLKLNHLSEISNHQSLSDEITTEQAEHIESLLQILFDTPFDADSIWGAVHLQALLNNIIILDNYLSDHSNNMHQFIFVQLEKITKTLMSIADNMEFNLGLKHQRLQEVRQQFPDGLTLKATLQHPLQFSSLTNKMRHHIDVFYRSFIKAFPFSEDKAVQEERPKAFLKDKAAQEERQKLRSKVSRSLTQACLINNQLHLRRLKKDLNVEKMEVHIFGGLDPRLQKQLEKWPRTGSIEEKKEFIRQHYQKLHPFIERLPESKTFTQDYVSNVATDHAALDERLCKIIEILKSKLFYQQFYQQSIFAKLERLSHQDFNDKENKNAFLRYYEELHPYLRLIDFNYDKKYFLRELRTPEDFKTQCEKIVALEDALHDLIFAKKEDRAKKIKRYEIRIKELKQRALCESTLSAMSDTQFKQRIFNRCLKEKMALTLGDYDQGFMKKVRRQLFRTEASGLFFHETPAPECHQGGIKGMSDNALRSFLHAQLKQKNEVDKLLDSVLMKKGVDVTKSIETQTQVLIEEIMQLDAFKVYRDLNIERQKFDVLAMQYHAENRKSLVLQEMLNLINEMHANIKDEKEFETINVAKTRLAELQTVIQKIADYENILRVESMLDAMKKSLPQTKTQINSAKLNLLTTWSKIIQNPAKSPVERLQEVVKDGLNKESKTILEKESDITFINAVHALLRYFRQLFTRFQPQYEKQYSLFQKASKELITPTRHKLS